MHLIALMHLPYFIQYLPMNYSTFLYMIFFNSDFISLQENYSFTLLAKNLDNSFWIKLTPFIPNPYSEHISKKTLQVLTLRCSNFIIKFPKIFLILGPELSLFFI